MTRALPWVLICCLFPFFLIAQYQKGSVWLMSGEKLEGYIQQEAELDMQKRIYFKTSLGKSTPQVFSPNEAEGFYLEKGAVFHTILIRYSEDGINFQERQFAKLVVRGTIDLYLSQQDIEEDNFAFHARKDDRLHKLSQEEDHIYSYARRNQYKGILNALTFDCKKRIGDINQVPFTRKRIVETVNSYNACQDANYKPIANNYRVAKEKRYFAELFGGPLIAKRTIGSLNGIDQRVEKEIFALVGIGVQMETFKPSLSRKLIVHNSLEANKWVPLEESGVINAPFLSLGFNISAHYLFSETAKVKWFTRVGGSFIIDIGNSILPRPGLNLGFGAYLPSGGRISAQFSTLSIFGGEGLNYWRFGYAIPLAVVQE